MPDMNLQLLLPEMIVAVVAMLLLLVTAWNSGGLRWVVGTGTLFGVLLAAGSTFGIQGGPTETTFGGLFINDAFSSGMKMLMYAATILPILTSWRFLERTGLDQGEYHVLSLFALLGGMIMASAGDFITLYLGIELMSLSVYVLAAIRRDDRASNEAGLKYFVLGSLASGILLYGVTFIYGATGTTQFSALAGALAGDLHGALAIKLGVALVIAGLAFKVAAAPFHMWAPDVYQGAPTSVTAFMAVMPKVAAFAGIYRVLLEAFGSLHAMWGPALQFLALLSLALGAFAAIAQTNIKRMLAYSSIGHVGYALIGLAAGNAVGIQAVVLYIAIYIFMNVGAFAVLLLLSRDGFSDDINEFKGMAKKRPVLAFIMALFMFSMAGVPPLAGFIGKLYVFMAAVKAGMMTIAILGVLFSAVGAFYYLRIVKLMYFDEPEQEFAMEIPFYSQAVIAVSCAVILFWGVFPGALLEWSRVAVGPFL